MPAITTDTNGTHADRPISKWMVPFRFIPRIFGGKQQIVVEYDNHVPVGQGKTHAVVQEVVVDPPETGCFNEPLGFYIKQLAEAYWAMEARVDGLLAAVDQMTTDNRIKDGQIARLKDQLDEIQSRVKRGEKKNA